MLNIYITRHGETQWNQEGRLQGWKNSPLTEKGMKYASLLGKKLEDVPFQTIFSSPSGRAVQTAELIRSERKIPIEYVENLKEFNFGDWEGKTKEDIKQLNWEDYENFWKKPHLYNHRPHKGESLQNLKDRIKDALTEIVQKSENGNILIVSHAIAIRAMLAVCQNIPDEKFWDGPYIEGTSLTLFTWNGAVFSVEKIGDMSHIELVKK